jgi:hypothetical protein
MANISQMVTQTAQQLGVDPAIALEVAIAESNLNPNATSIAGALGVMQLEPSTAAQYGVTDPFDPAQNIRGGVLYLRDLLSRYGGNVAQALAAYDWGPGNLSKAMAQYGQDWLSHAPFETRNYVGKILGNLGSAYQVAVTPASVASGAVAMLAPSADSPTAPSIFDFASLTAGGDAGAGFMGLSPSSIFLLLAAGLGAYLLADLVFD